MLSKRGKSAFSNQVVKMLRSWLYNHQHFPYPSDQEKVHLSEETGLTLLQICNWFNKSRRRTNEQCTMCRRRLHETNGRLNRFDVLVEVAMGELEKLNKESEMQNRRD